MPILVSSLFGQLYTIIDRRLASGLDTGSLAALNFSNKLVQLPIGLFITALATAIYPALSEHVAQGNLKKFAETISSSMRVLIILLIPSSVALRSLGVVPDLLWGLALVSHIAVTTVIVLALNYLFSTAAFYAPVQAEEISSHVRSTTASLSTYPLSGMSVWVQLPLLTVFPAGLLGWFPTLALFNKAPLGLSSFFPAIVAAILISITAVLFRRGMQHYFTAGSNRYSAIGHRR